MRCNIDLPVDTLQKLSAMASSQGLSLKTFIENVLKAKTESSDVPYTNPSPSGDSWFDDPENMASLDRGIEDAKQGKTIAMKPGETLDCFLGRVELCM